MRVSARIARDFRRKTRKSRAKHAISHMRVNGICEAVCAVSANRANSRSEFEKSRAKHAIFSYTCEARMRGDLLRSSKSRTFAQQTCKSRDLPRDFERARPEGRSERRRPN